MKTSELRIGNYVMIKNDLATVDRLSKDNTGVFRSLNAPTFSSVEVLNIKPIQLTEEWLFKFRFKKDVNYIWESECFGVTINSIHDRFLVEFGNGGQIYLKHIHQLQNLYFALTNEELTI